MPKSIECHKKALPLACIRVKGFMIFEDGEVFFYNFTIH